MSITKDEIKVVFTVRNIDTYFISYIRIFQIYIPANAFAQKSVLTRCHAD